MINSISAFQNKVTNVFEKIKSSSKEEDFIFGKGNAYSVSIAKTLSDYKQCFQLVYESYLEKGLAEADSEKMWYSIFNADPGTTTIQIKKEDAVIATLTLIIDSPLGIPADDLYKTEIDIIRKNNFKVSEVSSFAINPKFRGKNRILLKLTEFVIFIAKEISQSNKLLITIHPHHADYYQNHLLFEKLGIEKEYPKVAGALAVLYGLDFKQVEKEIQKTHNKEKTKSSYRFHSLYISRKHSINKIKTQMQAINLPLFIYFFIKKNNFFKNTSMHQKEYIRHCYKRKLIRFNPSIII